MKHGIFITGTGTGVGKTYVAAGLAAALRSTGVDVGVMKPIETGCRTRNGVLIPRDAVTLCRAAAVNDPLDQVNPFRFREPLAPAVAAERAGAPVRIERIVASFRTLRRKHDFLIVEGAGGIMVPLTYRSSFIDLAASLGLPVIVVALPGLGTINHTLLTVAALRSREIRIVGIVINYGTGGKTGIAEETSPAIIERISGIPILCVIRQGQRDFNALAMSVAASAGSTPDRYNKAFNADLR
jgi:dethiobiotin synthetase